MYRISSVLIILLIFYVQGGNDYALRKMNSDSLRSFFVFNFWLSFCLLVL